MSSSNHTPTTRCTRAMGRTAGCLAGVTLMIGALAAPASAQFDPPSPTPNPWSQVDLSRPVFEPAVPASATEDDAANLVAVGLLGAISGVVLTAGMVGVAAAGRRRRQPGQLLHG